MQEIDEVERRRGKGREGKGKERKGKERKGKERKGNHLEDLIVFFFQAGAYVLNLFNIQSGGISLLFLAFFEVITISWGYGTDRFVCDIERMVGRRILPWWAFTWKFFSPVVILGKISCFRFL